MLLSGGEEKVFSLDPVSPIQTVATPGDDG